MTSVIIRVRYPDVFTTLDRPRKGGSTLESPQRPSEVEGEVEVEALPTTQPTIQSEALRGGGQEEPNLPAERLAKVFFMLLDQPRDQAQNAGLWESQVAALLKTHSEEEIASVMEHAIKNDTFSAEYLTIAKHPMKSFVKTYDNLYKGWKALQKGAAAAANRQAKLKPTTSSAPGGHGNDSGMEF